VTTYWNNEKRINGEKKQGRSQEKKNERQPNGNIKVNAGEKGLTTLGLYKRKRGEGEGWATPSRFERGREKGGCKMKTYRDKELYIRLMQEGQQSQPSKTDKRTGTGK